MWHLLCFLHSALLFMCHFTGTKILQRLYFPPNNEGYRQNPPAHISAKRNRAALLTLAESKGEVLPRCLRWRPSQILIISYVNTDFHGCQWECINFHASLGRRPHLLHRRCDTRVCAQGSMRQLSTHNYIPSHTRICAIVWHTNTGPSCIDLA